MTSKTRTTLPHSHVAHAHPSRCSAGPIAALQAMFAFLSHDLNHIPNLILFQDIVHVTGRYGRKTEILQQALDFKQRDLQVFTEAEGLNLAFLDPPIHGDPADSEKVGDF
ncbi:MAG TPA: hypothetical protein PK653_01925 [Syntrophales bacterium]|nr:hypothetical protein [Syntrophales bacterium]